MNFSKFNSNASLNQLLDGFFNSTIGEFIGSDIIATHPRVNIIEQEKHFDIHLAAPGLDKNDFHISIEDNTLKIAVKKENQEDAEVAKYRRREFAFTSFERSFNLPDGLNTEHIEASYKNGILNLKIAKVEKEELKNVKIEIN